jgi:hypothetical protein
MAKYQLGAIVTSIVGSIGGTTFKRNGASSIMMRKSNGASSGKLFNNSRLANNSTIFRSWNSLTEEAKLAWEANARATKVKDKFGNDVNLSGVSFQRKCELAGQVFFFSNIDPTTFTTDIFPFTLGDVTINWADNNLKIFYDAPDGSVALGLMLEYSQKNLNAPQFTRKGVFSVFEATGDSSFTIDLSTIPSLSFLNANYNLRLYAYGCNASGWTTPQVYKDVILA